MNGDWTTDASCYVFYATTQQPPFPSAAGAVLLALVPGGAGGIPCPCLCPTGAEAMVGAGGGMLEETVGGGGNTGREGGGDATGGPPNDDDDDDDDNDDDDDDDDDSDSDMDVCGESR